MIYLEDASQLIPKLQHCTSLKLNQAGEFKETKHSSPTSNFCTYYQGIIKIGLPRKYQPALQMGPRCKEWKEVIAWDQRTCSLPCSGQGNLGLREGLIKED